MKRAAVAVIGGGVMGASVAYHLAARGQRDVLVLDRAERAGAGSTGRATGGFRAQYGTAINVRLSLLARAKLEAFRDETGVDPGYVQAGYLWLAVSQPELDALDAGRRVQHAEGLHEARAVTPEDIGRLNPAIRLDGIVGGAFCPTDGFIRPLAILDGYLAAAARLGVRVEWGVTVTGLRRSDDGRIDQVETSNGPLAVDTVVNAAGPWAAAVADLAGAPIPLTPLRRQIVPTVACDLLPADMPMTIWAGDGFHLRVRDGRVLLLWPTPGAPGRPFDTSVDPAWIDAVTAMAHARLPRLRSVSVDRGAAWAGLYEMSPDKHAILGALAACPNLYCLNGSSGHGVMHAPALGQLLAEIICEGRATTLDARCLAPDRFERGAQLPVAELL
ncbi:MAG TPA: FAD-dependent oxidoreductase [Gemmatimonadales bacterium]|nr:FAD-dependent oxidoreductase [Gemmatimonadales bacterium]